MIKGKNKIDGTAMPMSMATLLEMEMQDDISKFRSEYPELAKINVGDKPIGKVMVFGTAGDLDTNGFENIWKSGNGQRRVF